MLRWFENTLNAFPDTPITPPPRRFFAFVWACTEGLRGYLFAMTLLTTAIGAFEALLFAMMGKIVDRLAQVQPALLWSQERGHLLLLAAILLASTLLVGLHTLIKHQTLAGNFPMRMRWNFHRLMLGQSMDFFHDEFAGRVSAKVMQTALAVREMWFILADIMVYVTIYFTTLVSVVGSFHPWMTLPFLGWLACYGVSLVYFIPRLSKVSQAQADARALMTGRITDAYANIATVKLFSHAGREAGYARSAMQDFLGVVHKQMRYVSAVEVLNHVLNMVLIVLSGGAALWLWSHGEVGAGGVAAVTAMALRLNGISHWVMWEMTSLFEQVGTVQDGINTLSLTHTVQDAPDAQPLQVSHGAIRFEGVAFGYGGGEPVLDHFSLDIRPGEKIGLVGRSGAGKSTLVNLLLRFYDLQQGRILTTARTSPG